MENGVQIIIIYFLASIYSTTRVYVVRTVALANKNRGKEAHKSTPSPPK